MNRSLSVIFNLCIAIGASCAFALWQQSPYAGWWMFMILTFVKSIGELHGRMPESRS
jgi:hypothetical protein